jgi:hypothetical protein
LRKGDGNKKKISWIVCKFKFQGWNSL